MAKSIIQEDKNHCFLCGRNGCIDPLEKHHVFGAYNRKWSEKYGLTVYLCGDRCHRNGKESAHRNAEAAQYLHEMAQKKAMEHYGWTEDDFRSIFGKSYL